MDREHKAMRTYGDKPRKFQLEDGGEYFYIGSEVTASYKTWFDVQRGRFCSVQMGLDPDLRFVLRVKFFKLPTLDFV